MDRIDLSHDAFTINGVYPEDVISGYMTYKAAGRESLGKQIETYANGTDGETIKNTRFPSRTITISYLMQGTSLADMREKMHKLQTLLNTNEAQIIFNDDPTSYYIATPVLPEKVGEAYAASYGTFDLVCYDPFKYSTTLTTVATTNYTETVTDEDGNTSSVASLVLTTDNTGGYKTFPTFTVNFATDEDASGDIGSDADCGYVLFAKGGTDYSVQIGNDEEKDTSSVTVVDHNFTKATKGGFADANTITPFRSLLVYNGSSKATSKGLMLNSTTNVSKKFHGPLVVYSISSADQPSGEFTLKWKNIFACAKDTATGKKQCGAVWIMLMDSSSVVKMAYGLEKSSTSTLNAKEYVYDYSTGLHPAETYSAKYTGASGYKKSSDTTGRLSTCSMERKLVYDDNNVLDSAHTIIHAADGGEIDIVEDTPCTIAKIAVFFGKYGSAAGMYSNRVTELSFVNGNVDVINSFGSGDVAVVDCGKAEILLNDKSSADLGDVGNNWEDMYLDVGVNTIYVQYSDWVAAGYEPTIAMQYRKRWL